MAKKYTSQEEKEMARLDWILDNKSNTSQYDDVFEKPGKAYSVAIPPTIGALLTVGVLGRGLYYMLQRDSWMQQKMMRYRVSFQFFSFAAMVGGVAYADRNKLTLNWKFSSLGGEKVAPPSNSDEDTNSDE